MGGIEVGEGKGEPPPNAPVHLLYFGSDENIQLADGLRQCHNTHGLAHRIGTLFGNWW